MIGCQWMKKNNVYFALLPTETRMYILLILALWNTRISAILRSQINRFSIKGRKSASSKRKFFSPYEAQQTVVQQQEKMKTGNYSLSKGFKNFTSRRAWPLKSLKTNWIWMKSKNNRRAFVLKFLWHFFESISKGVWLQMVRIELIRGCNINEKKKQSFRSPYVCAHA